MEKTKNQKGKKKRMIILFSILGVVVVFAAAVLLTAQHANTPTKGQPITRYENPRSALLVMDVQNDITNNYSGTAGFVESVNQAIAFAEESGMEILYVKNIAGKNPIARLLYMGRFKDGTTGAEFDSRLRVVNGAVFKKYIGDSFSSEELEKALIANQVDTLYIVGADAAGCVYRTAQGGKNRGYNVNIVKDAVITVNEKTMTKMLGTYHTEGFGVMDIAEFTSGGE